MFGVSQTKIMDDLYSQKGFKDFFWSIPIYRESQIRGSIDQRTMPTFLELESPQS